MPGSASSASTQPTSSCHLPLQEKRLVRLSEEGDDSHVERLKLVYQELQAMGADQAEPKARRILAVSGTLT